jgi:hypothetical protein
VTRITSEKSKGLCRLLVIPNIRDVLVLQVVADNLWATLRGKSPTKKSFYAPKDHAFLKMRRGLEDEYGSMSEWLKFQNEILGFTTSKNFVAVTDVANYYDWIRYSTLRAVLLDYVEAKEVSLDLLLFVLGSMGWKPDYMPSYDIGLPQCDFDAPRLLAHAFLFEIDELLRDYPGVDFARYADDIDIGTDTYSDAKKVLRDLDLVLQSRHLRLNSGKTQILTAAQAERHFCLRENSVLSSFEDKVDKVLKAGGRSNLPHRMLPWLTARWLRTGRFEVGNGLKLLKRIVGYSRKYSVPIDEEIFLYAFVNWPSVRESLLRYVGYSINPFGYVERLAEALESGQIIDDIMPLRIATAVVSARFTMRFPPGCLERLQRQYDVRLPFQAFALIWIASRFSGWPQLRRLIDQTSHVWSTEPILLRGVSGMLPLFRGTRSVDAFVARLTTLGGAGASAVFEFYGERIFAKKGFSSVSKFIGAQNKSSINGITHSKFLMLYGYLSCPDFTKGEKGKFLLKHVTARRDLYYRFQVDQKLRSIP